jgi:invasion protein IalB
METSMALRSRWRIILWLLAIPAICLVVASTSDAIGQAAGQPEAGNSDQPREAEMGPRGEHMPRAISYSPWRKLCFKDSLGKVICRTTTSGTWETEQVAVRVDLIERKEDNATRLQIFLPVGLYLQAGVKVTVDDEPSVRIPYSWCLANLCVAGNLIDQRLLRAMQAGRKLTLEVVDSNLLTVASTVSLDQFAIVHKGPPDKMVELPDNEN